MHFLYYPRPSLIALRYWTLSFVVLSRVYLRYPCLLSIVLQRQTVLRFFDLDFSMKTVLIAGFVASALLGQAAASWTNAKSLSTPSNTDNSCNPDQDAGFDWSTLQTGGFNSYGGLSFSGFTCTSSFSPSKRSLRTRNDFQVSPALQLLEARLMPVSQNVSKARSARVLEHLLRLLVPPRRSFLSQICRFR